ncbi:Myb-like DNA-binding domain-containing protein (plasmid) [Bacillus sp. 31A1R]|uniref:Myb-like DNA-binding domain-containing protein n=1 Tax=Robertmurraya mangrovi TaxID=3098077 RepID=A0ABU5IUN7_9BACI|nr:Myb-like DNA-binding domain-containing protein [Bacillus sp. 31A1R]MDZ5470862.1 Myb-like DNA-binding domain-containing protein [Bacillus sp. 31A1R]
MKTRKDAWTEEDDQFLYETVMEYTQNGDSKASAYRKASDVLGRTVTACAYRWNRQLKHKMKINHIKEVSSDQKEESLCTELMVIETNHSELESIQLDDVIQFLIDYNKQNEGIQMEYENKGLKEEHQLLSDKQRELEQLYEEKLLSFKQLREKYEALAKLFKGMDDELLRGNMVH